jgi:surfactin synthase thioesterase subunit
VPLAVSPGAVTVVCVPYAGGRSGVFAPLARALGDLNVLAVELPGHGQRVRERPLTSMADVVAGLAPAVSQGVSGKFVLLGASMGAVVALALAQALQEAGGAEPDHLIVSASRAPSDLEDDDPWHVLPDDQLIAKLIGLGAEPEPFEHPELRAFVLPVLRADLEVTEKLDTGPRPPLPCPITTIAGTRDPDSPPSLMSGWERETTGGCHSRTIAGGHFLLEECPADMAAVVRDVLDGHLL